MAKDALGHGSYSGKYPNKIRDVGSIGQRGVVRATTNAGEHYDIHARDTGGLMPKPGEDIGKHPYAARVGGPSNSQAASQLASGAKSAPIPTHDSMGTPRLADNIQNAAKGLGYKYASLKSGDEPRGYNEHGSRHGYNPDAVNSAIAAQNRSGRGKVGGREASMIHRLLKGR
jgi:hypothetical protein